MQTCSGQGSENALAWWLEGRRGVCTCTLYNRFGRVCQCEHSCKEDLPFRSGWTVAPCLIKTLFLVGSSLAESTRISACTGGTDVVFALRSELPLRSEWVPDYHRASECTTACDIQLEGTTCPSFAFARLSVCTTQL